jgi:hypothetical protein
VEIPVLVAKVPARPTVESFAETLLYQVGDPLPDKSGGRVLEIKREINFLARVPGSGISPHQGSSKVF